MAKSSTKSRKSTSSKSRTGVRRRVATGEAGVSVVGPQGSGGIVVHVDDTNRKDELQPVVGRAAIIKKGEHEGTVGVIYEVTSYSSSTGYPKDVVFKPRNTGVTLYSVNYDDIEALPGGFGER